ncbi:MAG: hypothetical protein AAGF12_26320 [Myxococcota bacterium]
MMLRTIFVALLILPACGDDDPGTSPDANPTDDAMTSDDATVSGDAMADARPDGTADDASPDAANDGALDATINPRPDARPDGPLDQEECDPKLVQCRRLPPTCVAGEVPAVDGTCLGPCIDQSLCRRPIACNPRVNPGGQCPVNWECLDTGECAPPR